MHDDVIEASAAQLFWQTLAQAFLPPMDAGVAGAFVGVLADDLAELGQALGIDGEDEVAQFRRRAARFTEPTALLVEYSRLFLPPAGVATLNLRRLVDSGTGGPCMDALDGAYQAYGLVPSDRLHDFADHAARQLECLATLVDSDDDSAAEFAGLCLVGALPRLAAGLAQAAPESPYTALASLAAKAVRAYRRAGGEAAIDKPNRRHDLTLGVWRACSDCGKPYAREKEISIMTLALEQAGLPAAHLARCPDCRDRAQGFFHREIA